MLGKTTIPTVILLFECSYCCCWAIFCFFLDNPRFRNTDFSLSLSDPFAALIRPDATSKAGVHICRKAASCKFCCNFSYVCAFVALRVEHGFLCLFLLPVSGRHSMCVFYHLKVVCSRCKKCCSNLVFLCMNFLCVQCVSILH